MKEACFRGDFILLTMEELDFLSKTTYIDESGHTMAKNGLSVKAKERLASIDECHLLTQGVHLLGNFRDVGATENLRLFYEQMTTLLQKQQASE